MKRLLLMLMLSCSAHAADMVQHPHEAGFSSTIGIDYDGNRHRTSPWDFAVTAEWGTKEYWAEVSLDAFCDLKRNWRMPRDGYATFQLGTALYRNNEDRLYVNATLDVDVHSQLAGQGVDITPELNVAKGLTEDLWIGGNIGGSFATAPDAGNHRGYGSLTFWVTYLSGWLPNETDSISFSIWAANNEVPGTDKALFLSLSYQFGITEHLEGTVGIGVDPSSPWEKVGAYGIAGLKWRF